MVLWRRCFPEKTWPGFTSRASQPTQASPPEPASPHRPPSEQPAPQASPPEPASPHRPPLPSQPAPQAPSEPASPHRPPLPSQPAHTGLPSRASQPTQASPPSKPTSSLQAGGDTLRGGPQAVPLPATEHRALGTTLEENTEPLEVAAKLFSRSNCRQQSGPYPPPPNSNCSCDFTNQARGVFCFGGWRCSIARDDGPELESKRRN
ncbi:hypothetical protein NHX12_003327 [Muraenolepis orangiensis]|uniref:Uncharacterized protein n=1 Tax=Muraenolepis orangiensis TaxID=630683 RepID=A0A9Q0E2L0_9TELE|nr:hypothetical protein NHX12_003327 [Muraenolepis orangiensis]